MVGGPDLCRRRRGYSFDLKQSRTHDVSPQPPFINIQQFYVEWFLVDRIYEIGIVELRWNNRVVGIDVQRDHVSVDVETPAGRYRCEGQWLVDCTGAHSPIAQQLQIGAKTNAQLDRWCISDVRFRARAPAQRWTWIEAPFNDNRAVWQHLMADDVWRLDYQMPADADPEAIAHPDVVRQRLARQFGPGVQFDLVWVGPYAYRSRCLDTFRAGRVMFAGDAAHVMSPFGARGGNSGVQDADNLVWKLALVLLGQAPIALLDSYDAERRYAAQENIRITDRTTRFLSPPSAAEHVMRDAVIALARHYPFARAFVNTGRLSAPTRYVDSPLNSGGCDGRSVQNVVLTAFDDEGRPHASDLVALGEAGDGRLMLLLFVEPGAESVRRLLELSVRYAVRCIAVVRESAPSHAAPAHGFAAVRDSGQELRRQCDALACAAALLRPDLHLAATFAEIEVDAVEGAIRRVLGTER